MKPREIPQGVTELENQTNKIATKHGRTTQTQKPFNTLSAIGIGYGVTNTAVGIPLVIATTIPLGGSPQVFWGFLLMAVVGLATATTLAELISAMPHPGGQYIWVNKLAPERYRRGLSYTTAMISWISAIATGASGNLSVPLNAFSIVTLLRPSFVYQRWMGFLMFQVINVVTCLGACFLHVLPSMSSYILGFNVLSVGVIVVTLFATSSTHTSATNFFTINNVSGWPNGVAFIIGCNGINWCFSCLDVATHLAEEIPSPETNIPKALIWTIVIASSSGMLMVLAILLNIGPIEEASYSGVDIFYRITDSKAAAVGLWIPVLILVLASVWGIQTWQSRLAWTISRESGFPLHPHFSKIFPHPFYTPIWSLLGSAVGTALFGCLYLASELAFNSLIATGILLQYLSYSIPTLLVLWHGRSNFRHGHFWYPRLGLLANLIMLAWTVTALIFYCFPSYAEVRASQMKYVSAVMMLIAVFIISLWFLYAKTSYKVVELVMH
ncbi:choline transport protein [Pseudovirgaria hyperparasitica]|uniref:Choline transport protein n=1 Tax=Pseudovirgaria hyperparasitica TaxID=470096 RepID=A0A6A6WJL6_9PEZI|nr:choline transport protein [Pseudovirgaria hyperparasitica]KAF2762465.1 choline transport protein [Pseudovirgaria hyperparasitica]